MSEREEYERVVEGALRFEGVEDRADRLIHSVDLCRINRHPQRLPLRIARRVERPSILVARTDLPTPIDEAGITLCLVSPGSHRIPADAIFRLVERDLFFARMQRPMRRGEGHVAEEGPAVIALDLIDGSPTDRVGVVEVRIVEGNETLIAHERMGFQNDPAPSSVPKNDSKPRCVGVGQPGSPGVQESGSWEL